MAPPDRAEFDALKAQVNDPATGLPGLASLKAIVSDQVTGLPALAALKKQINEPKIGLDGLDARLKDIENPDWLWLKLQKVKGDLQLAATHAQAFKFDYSALKFDERGLTLFGKPILGSDKLTLGFITDWINKKLGRPGGPPAPTAADLQKTNDTVSQLKGELTKHLNRITTLENDIGTVTRNVGGLRKDLTDVSQEVKNDVGKVRTLANNADKRAEGAGNRADNAFKKAEAAGKRADNAFKKAGEALTTAKAARGRADKAMEDLDRQARGTSQDIKRLQDSIEKLDAALK